MNAYNDLLGENNAQNSVNHTEVYCIVSPLVREIARTYRQHVNGERGFL